jgi:hypothetical protein
MQRKPRQARYSKGGHDRLDIPKEAKTGKTILKRQRQARHSKGGQDRLDISKVAKAD